MPPLCVWLFPSHSWRFFVAILVFLSCFLCLCTTISDYGITWDEAETNFPAARRQTEWFRLLFQGENVLHEGDFRTYFETESDHPSLPRTLMAVSRLILPESIPDRIAFALPTSILASCFSACFFCLLWKRSGILLATFGVIVLYSHPHWFGHAHFAEYDILVAMAWFMAAMTFFSAMEAADAGGSWGSGPWIPHLFAALACGLAISVKIHAVFLPLPLLAWALLYRKWQAWRWGVLSLCSIPVLYVATQPFLWWHTFERILNRFQDYGAKVPIHVYYFGHLYPGDVPWHYPWVMLLVTLPAGIVIPLFAQGAGFCFRKDGNSSGNLFTSRRWVCFLVLNALTLPLIFTFKSAYDGLRFFLSSLPFLVLLSVSGLESISGFLSQRFGKTVANRATITLCVLLAANQVHTCWRIHPFQLSYYSFLAGGVRGAASLGLETTHWCDSITPTFIQQLTDLIPQNARVATHAMDDPPLVEYQKMGIAPVGWKFIKEGPADCRIIQFRQGFFGPLEYRLVGERTPIAETALDGIPLARAYLGP